MMSIKAPEGSKRGGKLIDSNQAMILVARGDLHGAKKLLSRNIENSGVLYPRILENLVTVNMQLLGQEKNKDKIIKLQDETIGYMLKLYEKSSNPFYYYRIGQFYLSIGNKPEAQRYFSMASLSSPEGAYYKQAATKLAEKLKQ
jgi:tetratricopeptide (TPR) repeat protein